MVGSAIPRLPFLAAVLALTSCGGCGIEPFGSSTSPTGEMTLRLERKNCGATTGYLYMVVAYEKGETDGTTVLKFDGDHGRFDWPSPWEDNKLLDMKWIGPSRVKIVMNYPAHVYDDRKTVDDVGVQITYKPGTTRAD